jgi:hypothetical protein
MTPMDAAEQKALADIEQYGCHVLHVLGDETGPPFSYSVGVQKTTGAPEVVVLGLAQPVAHFVVNEYNRRVRAGERFEVGARYDGFLEGFAVQVERVAREHYAEYLGWNRWLYGSDDFAVLQILYPTAGGTWPWEPGGQGWFLSDYPTCEQTHVTLRVYPESLDPGELTARLGLEPTCWQRKGEASKPGGRVASLHGWFLSSEGVLPSRDVGRHLDWLLAQLLPRAEALLALQGEGCRLDVFCFWVSASGHGGPTVRPDQMAALARLNLELGFDVYFGGEGDGPEGAASGR